MTLRLPMRTIAPVIVLAILAGIVATFMVSRTLPAGAESSLGEVAPRTKPAPVRKPAAKIRKAPATPTKKTKPAPAPVAPAPVRKPIEQPKGDPVDANGLPLVLSRALARKPVAVVVLYDPNAAVDEMALAEARAGAREANARFVAIDIRNERQARPLAQLLGVLENPSVLVYRRPSTMFVRIDGFSDRQTVAQAAANARP